MVLLDTSALVEALTGPRRGAPALRRAIQNGELLLLPPLVLYEWLRGPRSSEEIANQETLFSRERAVPFEAEDAALGARLFGAVRRPRGREVDLAIAACAINRDAMLWTVNHQNFADIPGLKLCGEAGR